ncbi:hypothetical protein GVAV_001589 [Gurleya vavrai]
MSTARYTKIFKFTTIISAVLFCVMSLIMYVVVNYKDKEKKTDILKGIQSQSQNIPKQKEEIKNEQKLARHELTAITEEEQIHKISKNLENNQFRPKKKEEIKNEQKSARNNLPAITEEEQIHKISKNLENNQFQPKKKEEIKNEQKLARNNLLAITEEEQIHKISKNLDNNQFQPKKKEEIKNEQKLARNNLLAITEEEQIHQISKNLKKNQKQSKIILNKKEVDVKQILISLALKPIPELKEIEIFENTTEKDTYLHILMRDLRISKMKYEETKNKEIGKDFNKNWSQEFKNKIFLSKTKEKNESCYRQEKEIQLLIIYIQINYELENENIYLDFQNRCKDFLRLIRFNFENINDMKDFICGLKLHVFELLHLLAVISFKYKNFANLIFNLIPFGNHKNFVSCLENYNDFKNVKEVIFLMISKLDISQIEECYKSVNFSETEKNCKNDAKNKLKEIYDFFFEYKKPKHRDNYLFNKNFTEDFNMSNTICESLNDIECQHKEKLYDKIQNLKNKFIIDHKNVGIDTNSAKEIFIANVYYFVNYIKHKFLNIKIILFCFGRLKYGNDKVDKKNYSALQGIDFEFLNKEFINKIVKLNERKFFYHLLKEIGARLIKFSEMEILLQGDVISFVDDITNIAKENSSEIIDVFDDYLKILDKKKEKND